MKRLTHLLVYLLMLILFCQGCSVHLGSRYNQTISTEYTETLAQGNNKKHTEIITCNDFYELTKTNGLYSYSLFDKEGNIAINVTNLSKEPRFLIMDNEIVRITTQAGTGIATQSGFFYDRKTNTKSQLYSCVFDQHNNLVAYVKDNKVIVQHIFEPNIFYQEISTFRESFSIVVFQFVDVEFRDDGSSICVTYYSGDDYAHISETFMLTNSLVN